MHRLPPLKALQAFESAGRHQSIKQAANELAVTTGAVSQQIKQLEQYLGVTLFHRMNKSVRLTAAGKVCLPYLEEGFNKLLEGVAQAKASGGHPIISISVAPTFGFKWLLPRLEHFKTIHPYIDLRIDTSTRDIDFLHEEIDLAIRYGPVKEKGLSVEDLTQEVVSPVCSPRLIADTISPEQLINYPLLHLEGRSGDPDFPDWSQWIKSLNLDALSFQHGPRFNSSSMVLQAALDGQGVAMGSSVLAADDLLAGRLVRLFPESQLTAKYSYRLLSTELIRQRPDVQRFVEWLKKEINTEIP